MLKLLDHMVKSSFMLLLHLIIICNSGPRTYSIQFATCKICSVLECFLSCF